MKHLISLLLICVAASAPAQKVAVKSNVAYDAATLLNLGIEYAWNGQWSAELSGVYNPFKFKNGKQWQTTFVQPEVRYWFGEAFRGHFIGIHAQSGTFDAGNINLPFNIAPGLKDYSYQGWFAGAGVAYGYQWKLGKQWNMEATLGIGYNHYDFEQYGCPVCGGKVGEGVKDRFCITKLGLSVIYVFD